jgi:hypothetical protein
VSDEVVVVVHRTLSSFEGCPEEDKVSITYNHFVELLLVDNEYVNTFYSEYYDCFFLDRFRPEGLVSSLYTISRILKWVSVGWQRPRNLVNSFSKREFGTTP